MDIAFSPRAKARNVTPALERNNSRPVLVPDGTNQVVMLRLVGESTCEFDEPVPLPY